MNDNPLNDSPGLQPAGSPHAGDNLDPAAAKELAAATHAAAQATEQLNKAVEKTNRLYRDSPAVKAANQQAEAARKLAREQERANKGKAAGGGVSRGPGVDRTNTALEAAFAAPLLTPRPPAADLRANRTLDEVFGVHRQGATEPRGVSRPTSPFLERTPPPERPDPVKERADRFTRETGRHPDGRRVEPSWMPAPLFPGQLDAMRRSSQPAPVPPTPPTPTPSPAADHRGSIGGGYRTTAGRIESGLDSYASIASSQDAFLDDRTRMRRVIGGIPGVGDLALKSFSVGEHIRAGGGNPFAGAAVMGNLNDAEGRRAFLRPLEADESRKRLEDELRRREAKEREYQIARFSPGRDNRGDGSSQVPQMSDLFRGGVMPDRGTVAGRQQYDLRERVLPQLDRLTAAMREVGLRQRTLSHATDERDNYRVQAGIDEKRADEAAAAAKATVNAVEQSKKYTEAQDYRSRAVAGRQREKEMGERIEAERKSLAVAEYEKKEATRGIDRVDLEDFGRREEVARGQAERLGMMGFDGRIQTLLAKRLMDQVGIENLPGESIQQAAVGFPESVRADAQRSGQGFVPDFRPFGKEEFRDTVPDISKAFDEQLRKVRQDGADNLRSEFAAFAEAVLKAIADREEAAAKEIKQLREQFVTESLLRNRGK